MKTSLFVGMIGLAGTAVLLGQLRAGAEPGGIAGGCTPGTGPDVIVGDLSGISRWGTIDGISAYSIGTTSCNIGDTPLPWFANTDQHPVIAQNFYRLKDGRFEQIGMSWLKHAFAAVTGNLCCTCQNPGVSTLLGVGCSDPYGSFLNGDQDGTPGGCGPVCGGLGPRYEVNAATGVFPYPYDRAGEAGDAIDKRLQVRIDDLDPVLNPGAKFYAEGHYVTPDDAAAANHHNNASYEEFTVGIFSQGSWTLVFTGETTRELPALWAWQDNDPQVVVEVVEDDGDPNDAHDGRFHLGYRVTDNGDGTWHYEYALHNLNAHRAARSFEVPAPSGVTVTGVGFHDVDYHSGDGAGGVSYDGADWTETVGLARVTWSTLTEAESAGANALRWGTLYNFRFDADAPPVPVDATIGLYRAGDPSEVTVATLGPMGPVCPWDLDGDGSASITDFLLLLGAWSADPGGPPDFDGDGDVGIADFLELLGNWGPCS